MKLSQTKRVSETIKWLRITMDVMARNAEKSTEYYKGFAEGQIALGEEVLIVLNEGKSLDDVIDFVKRRQTNGGI